MTAEASVVLPLMHSRSNPPRMGIIVRLFLNTGEERKASCTIVNHGGSRVLQWYDAGSRKVIDPETIKGWMPAIFRQDGLNAVKTKYGVGAVELRESIKPLYLLMEAYGMDRISIDRTGHQPVITIDGEVIR